jgi:glycosyltransferase involved in cell wall biosynthesis
MPAEIRVVEEHEMPALMRSADLLIHAAEVELEGMAVLEALGTGLPTLVADAPRSAAWTMAIGEAFRFPAGDAEELARRIDHLIEHPDELAAAREATVAAAAGRTLAASVAHLEAIYLRLARRSVLEAEPLHSG